MGRAPRARNLGLPHDGRRALSESVEARFQEQAESYDEETEWRAHPGILRTVCALAGRGPGKLVELGAGTGLVARVLEESGFTVMGVDISPAMLRRGQSRMTSAVVADAALVPFRPASFDGCVMRQLLHYVDDEVVCGCAYRLVRPGGWLVAAHVTVVDERDMEWWGEVKRFVQPLRRRVYSPSTIDQVVTKAGWRIEACRFITIVRRDSAGVFLSHVDEAERGRVAELIARAVRGAVHFKISWDGSSIAYTQGWYFVRARKDE